MLKPRRAFWSRAVLASLLLVLPACGLDTSESGADPRDSDGGGGSNGGARPGEEVESGDKDRPKNSELAVAEHQLKASLEDRQLTVYVPVKRVHAERTRGTLTLELYKLAGAEVVERVKLPYDLEEDGWTDLVAQVSLDRTIADQSDLVAYNVRVSDDVEKGIRVTRSLLTLVPRYEARLDGPARITADKKVSYRVRAHDPKTFAPVPDAAVELRLTGLGANEVVLEGTTDAQGDAFFTLSLAEAGAYDVQAQVSALGTRAAAKAGVMVESGTRSARVLLTTDKPIYQPGQLVHLRALSLDKGASTPRANAKLTFEITDAKTNKIFKRSVNTDAYGIAAVNFRLGSVLNMGTFTARATGEHGTSEKTFQVGRYVLPKFAVGVALDKPYYSAGEKVNGRLDARYFFGKNVVDGAVSIDAATTDLGQNVFAHVVGKTDAQGIFAFSFDLPSTLAGIPLEQGNARVALHAAVTDAAGQIAEKDAALIVAAKGARLVVVPENTQLVPGIENQLNVFLADPVGNPIADVAVTLTMDGNALSSVTTDAFGQASVRATPEATRSVVRAVAQLPSGKQLDETFTFATQEGKEHVLVRSERGVYSVGDTVKVEVRSSETNATVFLDWLHEGQSVRQHTLLAEEGVAKLDLTVDETLLGSNRIEAYVVDAGGIISRAGQTIFVCDDAALSIELKNDKPSYEPGQPAQLTFVVTDEEGKPAVAALGVQIVDEALFSMVDAKPGLLRTYFELDDVFATPQYELQPPPGSLSDLLFEGTRSGDEAADLAGQRRAQATFAALGSQTITGIHVGSWQATLLRTLELTSAIHSRERQAMLPLLRSVADAAKAALALEGCNPDSSYCAARKTSFTSAVRDYIYGNTTSYDPWGNVYVESGYSTDGLQFLTRGPDERSDTEDDGTLFVRLSELGVGGFSGADAGAGGNGWGTGGAGNGVSTGGSIGGTTGASPPVDDGGGAPGSEPRVRRDFPETLYVNPALITGPDGIATVTVPLADSITSWRVSTLANAQNGKLGGSAHGLVVFQDFFADINFPATLTRGDQVSFPIALYNYLDTAQTITVDLQTADWYTPLGQTSLTVELAPNQVKGLTFPVRVDKVGLHTLTVKAVGSQRSDAVERAVRVVPDGKRFAQAISGTLKQGTVTHRASYPANAVAGSGELTLDIYPAFLSSVVSGMDRMLQEPYGCFEQTTSTTWPNVLALRYMRDTQQVTPAIELKAETYISAGYQRLLTYEHPRGGFSWFGTQDSAPNVSVTAFGLLEFVDMSAVYEVDPALITRTAEWLAQQQSVDGSWPGENTEFFSFNTSVVRNTAFVLTALAAAGRSAWELERGLDYLRDHYKKEKDAYTLGLVATAFAALAPTDPTLAEVLSALDGMKKVEGTKVSWDSATTKTSFYGYGEDAVTTTTAVVAYALMSADSHPAAVEGAIEFLAGQRDEQGNFGSTQATISTLRTLLLAGRKGGVGAAGNLTIQVDGKAFATLELRADQADVLTTIDMATLATTGDHDISLDFVGTGQLSYNLVAAHYLPWSAVPPEAKAPLGITVTYDRKNLPVDDTVAATVTIQNQTASKANMILADVGIPPGFEVVREDLDAYVAARTLSKYEITPRQLILYVSELGGSGSGSASFKYRLRATMPVKASDGGATVYPYYEPDRKAQVAAQTLEAS